MNMNNKQISIQQILNIADMNTGIYCIYNT